MVRFSGFTAEDFDAYSPEKWRSNVFNLNRLMVKQKLEHIAPTLLNGVIDAMEVPGGTLTFGLSSEHPDLWNNHEVKQQHLYFLRPEEERTALFSRVSRARSMGSLLDQPSPYLEHVHLAVTIAQQGLQVRVCIMPEATVDRENVVLKIRDPWQQSELTSLLNDLAQRFTISVAGNPHVEASTAIEALSDSETHSVGQPRQLGKADIPILNVARDLDRGDPDIQSDRILDILQSDLHALIPLYRFIEWRRDNDHVELGKELKQEQEVRLRKGLEKNDPVRITDGLWAGKTGKVQAIEARGQVKVLVGTLTVQVKADDLQRIS
ncbi:MAG: hypothetical protein J7M25_05125 [Deltaproteobacteria bacterium]|nr:hypothetical protein [Deltaproteobacteria bacterium]